MDAWWPWLAVAGLGALHGLSPANGWMFAAACGLRAGDGAQARRVLLPIALGHTVSVGVVVMAVMQGVLMDRVLVQRAAGALLIAAAVWRGLRPSAPAANRVHSDHAGIALWSCLMATAQGAGLMLVPALVPLCMAGTPAREIAARGSVPLAVAAMTLHLAAMLLVTGAIAGGVCRGLAHRPAWFGATQARRAWTAAMGGVGLWLLLGL
ncbi:hypothetical protein [Lysobacter silvisoli]|uniref:Uncharacterized protein n=1 Tax=Lysobacter silvisoli TaxID=2293254 RepID=A0A371K018_9GAMM|nr:hypothetical protein [Lysobacter silvisoli]RDZ27265.1 hypothetical protein DX914_13540 [Lysobacter silvisoli]